MIPAKLLITKLNWKEDTMVKTALEFILEAKKWPLGRDLVTAVGTGEQEVESAVDQSSADQAREEAIKKIKELMKKEGVMEEEELKKAEAIYEALLKFIENTGFNPNLLPPHKYWR